MIDHIGLRVSDYTKSKAFYTKALEPIGYGVVMEFEGTTGGFGLEGKPDFWISQGEATAPVHVAFSAKDRQTVDAFHAAALAAGGRDNGKPGVREHYLAPLHGDRGQSLLLQQRSGSSLSDVLHERGLDICDHLGAMLSRYR